MNTQHIVIPIEVAKVEEVESNAIAEIELSSENQNNEEQTPEEDASYEVIPEQNNKQADEQDIEKNAEENQQQNSAEASENDELLNVAPSKERHADVGLGSNDDKKRNDSDVWIEIVSFGKFQELFFNPVAANFLFIKNTVRIIYHSPAICLCLFFWINRSEQPADRKSVV